jgi:hypothetical protein
MALMVDHAKFRWDGRVVDLDPKFQLKDAGLLCLVGVQSNQFPRAIDPAARFFCAAGIQGAVGGFHVPGCPAMLPVLPRPTSKRLANWV